MGPKPNRSSYRGDVAAEIKSGRPDEYFDYIEQAYGDAFRSGSLEGIETFALLHQQITQLGNQQAAESFGARFAPMLPQDARSKLVNEHLYITQKPSKPVS